MAMFGSQKVNRLVEFMEIWFSRRFGFSVELTPFNPWPTGRVVTGQVVTGMIQWLGLA